jgi:hypothetical protein
VVVAQLHTGGVLSEVGPLGIRFVLGTAKRLGIPVVGLAGIDKLPADTAAGELPLPDILKMDAPGNLEGDFPDISLGHPESCNQSGLEVYFDTLVQNSLFALVDSLPIAGARPRLHHYQFVLAHIGQADDGTTFLSISKTEQTR